MIRRLLVIPVAALAVAGCGSDNKKNDTSSATTSSTTSSTPAPSKPSTGGGSKLALEADPGGALKFTKDTLEAKAGTVTIEMKNPAPIPHAIAVEGNGVDKDGPTVQQGGTSKVTVTLKPGDYEFYCPVPGHKQGGMKGTLTVK